MPQPIPRKTIVRVREYSPHLILPDRSALRPVLKKVFVAVSKASPAAAEAAAKAYEAHFQDSQEIGAPWPKVRDFGVPKVSLVRGPSSQELLLGVTTKNKSTGLDESEVPKLQQKFRLPSAIRGFEIFISPEPKRKNHPPLKRFSIDIEKILGYLENWAGVPMCGIVEVHRFMKGPLTPVPLHLSDKAGVYVGLELKYPRGQEKSNQFSINTSASLYELVYGIQSRGGAEVGFDELVAPKEGKHLPNHFRIQMECRNRASGFFWTNPMRTVALLAQAEAFPSLAEAALNRIPR